MSRMRRNLTLALVVATCSAGALAACGDDDSSEPAASSAFCDAYAEATIQLGGEPDPDALTTAIESIDAEAPKSVAESAKVMTDAVRTVLASNGEDFSAFEAPEFLDAKGRVDSFVFDDCAFDATADVQGEDFAFKNLPDTIEAGRVAILFTNTGEEAHEIVFARRNDGVTESFDELLALPEEEAMAKVTPVGGAFAPAPDSSSVFIGDLEPGDYVAICFVPTGTTMGDGEMTEGTGAPHFTHGMVQEFTVTA